MAGYENLLAIVYHQGPPVLGSQATRVKILDCEKQLQVLFDTEFPITKYSKLTWCGFSTEGLLCSYDSDGQFRALNLRTQTWTPVQDFRALYPDSYKNLWIVGAEEQEILAIQLQFGFAAPHPSAKTGTRSYNFKVPLIGLTEEQEGDEEDKYLKGEEERIRSGLMMDHEKLRKRYWEQLKDFRSEAYDREYQLSRSIKNSQELVNQQRDLDKVLLGLVRIAAL